MKVVSAGHVVDVWWGEACKKVRNGVVFLDNTTAECLHWNGGLARLVHCGAKNVKEFSSFECGEEGEVKAVFLLGTSVTGTAAKILQDIIEASHFEYVVVITAGHPNVHALARYGGRETDEGLLMNQLEQSILGWMGNMNYTVEIFHIPLVVVPFADSLFFLPGFADLYPLLPSDVSRIASLHQATNKGERLKPLESLSDVEQQHLPLEMRVQVRQLVACLHSLLQGMNARDEVFTVGHTARLIGADLDAFPPARSRRKTAANKVSLVLVDRSLDLSGPAGFGGDCLMDRVMVLLPRLFGHHLDSAVNMAPLSEVHPSSEWTLVPGCLAPQDDDRKAAEVLKALMFNSKKEALAMLSKHVLDAANRKEPGKGAGEGGGMNMTNLKKNIQLFASDVEAFTQHASLLQQGLGVVEALDGEKHGHLDQLLSVQKLLVQSLGDAEDTPPFTQIFQLLKTRESRGVTLDEILSLMVYCASLGGPEVLADGDEYTLTNLLSQALVEDRATLSPTLLEIVGEEVDEVSALAAAQHIARQLNAIAAARQHLNTYRQLFVPGDSVQPASQRGLVPWVVQDSISSTPQDVPDIEYRSAGFRDLIKTGFSLFVNVSKPRPRDAPTVVVFVVGGVTAQEVREVRAVVEEVKPSCDVILASSHLAYPQDTILRAFRSPLFLPKNG